MSNHLKSDELIVQYIDTRLFEQQKVEAENYIMMIIIKHLNVKNDINVIKIRRGFYTTFCNEGSVCLMSSTVTRDDVTISINNLSKLKRAASEQLASSAWQEKIQLYNITIMYYYNSDSKEGGKGRALIAVERTSDTWRPEGIQSDVANRMVSEIE